MSFVLGKRSLDRLSKCHPDLQRVVKRAITMTTVDFGVAETDRTKERQVELFAAGATKTMNSRHLLKIPAANPELGPVSHAADLVAYVGGEARWDWPLYYKINQAMRLASLEEGVPIRWGGDWDSDGDYEDETFRDGPHYELPWKLYPVLG